MSPTEKSYSDTEILVSTNSTNIHYALITFMSSVMSDEISFDLYLIHINLKN